VIVQVLTDTGVSGWGEARVHTDVASLVHRLAACRAALIGQDALGQEAIHQRLGHDGGGQRLESAVIQAAINMALIDILGKTAGAPAYEVLGGPTREKARALAPLAGGSDAELMVSLERARQAGFRAVSVPLTLPSGPVRGRSFFAEIRQLLERMRAAAGEEVDFVLDCGGRTSPAEAESLAAELESFHVLWLDEPTAQRQQQSLGALAAATTTPLGWGRDVMANSEFQDLLRLDAIDVLRPEIGTCGVTQIRKAAALAETYYVAVAPAHRGGPIATAAALQVAASIPNFFIQEVPLPADDADLEMRRELAGNLEQIAGGFLALPRGPGLGIAVNEEALEKYRLA
jgi:galactonate dehydratase